MTHGRSCTPLVDAAPDDLAGIRGVCLDIDDTLTTRGRLTTEAYSSLWKLYEAGLWVVPVTGRPAGWCDHLVRSWPVDAVVGENGGFTFFMKEGRRCRLDTPGTRADARARLEVLRREILVRFPQAVFASDQLYREYDLAVDVCEDVPSWAPVEVAALLDFCRSRGAQAKLSSIHVNIWFGDYDKGRGIDCWFDAGMPGARDLRWGPSTARRRTDVEQWLFIGDSPNDEALFRYFPRCVGVSNVRQYLDHMSAPPRWITSMESGAGFAEMAAALLAARRRELDRAREIDRDDARRSADTSGLDGAAASSAGAAHELRRLGGIGSKHHPSRPEACK